MDGIGGSVAVIVSESSTASTVSDSDPSSGSGGSVVTVSSFHQLKAILWLEEFQVLKL